MNKLCPSCGTPLELKGSLEINQSVICSNCGLELEVIWLYPLELAKVATYNPDPTKRKKHPRKSS